MSDRLKLTPEQYKAFKKGAEMAKEAKERERLAHEEEMLLKDALALEKHDEIPELNVRYDDITMTERYEMKRLKELRAITSKVHDPSGTREEIESSK